MVGGVQREPCLPIRLIGLPLNARGGKPLTHHRAGKSVTRSDRIRILVRRLLSSLCASATLLLVLAPAALADNDGRGFYGATNDKVITKAGFILIIFFPTFVLLMSLLQWRLDKRKQVRKAAHTARIDDARWRGGW
jgi:preprotein translocase subunit SecG